MGLKNLFVVFVIGYARFEAAIISPEILNSFTFTIRAVFLFDNFVFLTRNWRTVTQICIQYQKYTLCDSVILSWTMRYVDWANSLLKLKLVGCSLYLWHWPLLVFSRMLYSPGSFMSIVSHFMVENPIRFKVEIYLYYAAYYNVIDWCWKWIC